MRYGSLPGVHRVQGLGDLVLPGQGGCGKSGGRESARFFLKLRVITVAERLIRAVFAATQPDRAFFREREFHGLKSGTVVRPVAEGLSG